MIEKVTYGLMRGGWNRACRRDVRASPLLYSPKRWSRMNLSYYRMMDATWFLNGAPDDKVGTPLNVCPFAYTRDVATAGKSVFGFFQLLRASVEVTSEKPLKLGKYEGYEVTGSTVIPGSPETHWKACSVSTPSGVVIFIRGALARNYEAETERIDAVLGTLRFGK